jgi:hypothetical protein
LDSLGVGYKILLGETWEPTDDMFEGYVQRAYKLSRHIGGLVRAVEDELREPPIPSERLSNYLRDYRALEQLESDQTPIIREINSIIRAHAARLTAGELRYDDYLIESRSEVLKLVEVGWVAKQYSDGIPNVEVFCLSIAVLVYADTLAPWSAE